ncbi:hypothetical protein [Jeotgalicoccus sp. WY2]|uniref:hypothetical protein n=1 Tax=Jeotgalicoccus sp. WY2 TaxID=2708346 RepID=UPI001BD1E032|nr:hypothetical protein [Jeotgalicoccus sp. WY2]
MKDERKIETSVLTSIIIILLIVFITFIWTLNFNELAHNQMIFKSAHVALTFLGVFSTFFGALIGAKISGDKALKISREEREEVKRKEVYSFQVEQEIKVLDLKIILQEKMPGNIYSYAYFNGEKKLINHLNTMKLKSEKIDEMFIEQLNMSKRTLLELKKHPGYLVSVDNKVNHLDKLMSQLGKFIVSCKNNFQFDKEGRISQATGSFLDNSLESVYKEIIKIID